MLAHAIAWKAAPIYAFVTGVTDRGGCVSPPLSAGLGWVEVNGAVKVAASGRWRRGKAC
jgi:hypothetical protein